MLLQNLKHPQQQVNFQQAVVQGLGKDRGLFFPPEFTALNDVEALLELDFVSRSKVIVKHVVGDEVAPEVIDDVVEQAFNFPCPLVKVDDKRYCLELFHGKTLAFKDFGARFMAQCLSRFSNGNKVTILTATSGDTGAAVADAFYGLDNVEVVILYPKGRISELQEKLFCTLGNNIHTVAVNADFDACQDMVKKGFEDTEFKQALALNSANSINISRLLAQVCYYFEAVAQYRKENTDAPVVAVPSGNFGNLTAGLIAKALGLPIKRFVAATNENDTVPRYLQSGQWQVNPTVATESNAMDVSDPSNWPRAEVLIERMGWNNGEVKGAMVSGQDARASVQQMEAKGYLSEPHAAIAAKALADTLADDEKGIFVGTAHPAKFKEVVEDIVGRDIGLPAELAAVADKQNLSLEMDADFNALKAYMLDKLG
ncbi:threonine synthase [Paraferrimonas sp. SM1919]|uniref:threonine synthase n=1 Tax=Paraferrimonas sp. SM1919 TaxID=2662263 RepID=UPI0013D78FC7|nr:threonine synthase [Paraferrimonas sp. SM1919]